MLRVDFHVHTKYSKDSLIDPAHLAAKAKKLGIVPAITDHDNMAGHQDFRRLRHPFIPGEEISTDSGDLIGLYTSELIPKKTPFPEALDLIHEQGGLAYLPHMFDATRSGVSHPEFARKADIIEIFNARSVMKNFNKKAEEFAKKHEIPGAAGSDSHFLFEFGRTYTMLPSFDLDNPKELLKALPKAEIFGKPAPIYVKGTTAAVKIWKKIIKR